MNETAGLGPLNVTDWGVTGDGATLNDTAMAAVLTHVNSTPRGIELFFPAGIYRFARPLEFERGVILSGEGNHGWAGPTILRFDDNTDGLVFHRPQTSPGGGAADWSTVRDLTLQTVNSGTQTTGTGIRCHCRINVNNVMITNFGLYGVWIGAGAGGTFGPYKTGTNANCGAWTNVDVWNSRSHGIVIDGNDANANVFQNVSSVANRGWGFYDSSGLGNNYIACHTDANTAGAYLANGNAQSGSFLACYSENSQGTGSLIGGFNLVLGGNHGAGFQTGSTAPVITGSSGGTAMSTRGIQVTNRQGVNTVRATLGVSNPSQAALSWDSSDETGNWSIQRDVGGWTGFWEIARNNGMNVALAIATERNTLGWPIGATMFPAGIGYANGPGSVTRHTLSFAAPTTGTWRRGDVVWNGSPAAGGTVGWVCVSPGTPGTWKTFGPIAP